MLASCQLWWDIIMLDESRSEPFPWLPIVEAMVRYRSNSRTNSMNYVLVALLRCSHSKYHSINGEVLMLDRDSYRM